MKAQIPGDRDRAVSRTGRRWLFAPSLHSEETIYGYASGIHATNGALRAEDTSRVLFGVDQAMQQHDLPTRLAWFSRVPGLPVRCAETLYRRHTVAAYYLPFLSSRKANRVLDGISNDEWSHAKRELGAASRTVPVSHPLKCCFECANDDLVNVGRTIWRVEHQFPTTTVCLQHDRPLHSLRGRHRRWLEPVDLCGRSAPLVELTQDGVGRALAEIGSVLRSVKALDMETLRAEALRRLRDLGAFHSGGQRAWHSRLVRWFSSTRLCSALETSASPIRKLSDGVWISTLLFGRRSSSPVRWVVLWAAIGMQFHEGAGKVFADAARGRRRGANGQFPLFDELPPPFRAPERVWDCLSDAASYEEVMAELGVTRHDVGRWLAEDQALHSMWKKQLHKRHLEGAEGRLRQYVRDRPGVTSTMLEDENAGDVKWLRMNAPAAFEAIRRGLTPRAARQADLFATGPSVIESLGPS